MNGAATIAYLHYMKHLMKQGRKGYPTHNVMLVCNFDMIFTFAVVGWPGTAHDTHILSSVLEEMKSVFPHPPEGKYYVVDAGYSNMKGYLAPFKGESAKKNASVLGKRKALYGMMLARTIMLLIETVISMAEQEGNLAPENPSENASRDELGKNSKNTSSVVQMSNDAVDVQQNFGARDPGTKPGFGRGGGGFGAAPGTSFL
ncbi:hypothetical protein K1719_033868 [Acacia pycnantha]|nr:hypothetical protein K1719_033868 [Acacia pycnantha]